MANPSTARYKIVLLSFPFDDFTRTKARPAVCLTDPIGLHDHIVVAFITSQIPADRLVTDIVIDSSDTDFVLTGLRTTSTIRLHRLATVAKSMIHREIGELPPALYQTVTDNLRSLFGIP